MATASPELLDRFRKFDDGVARDAPDLVSLVKEVDPALEALDLVGHQAYVALVLDTSQTMMPLYESGEIDHLTKRLAALASRLTPTGKIELFAFHQLLGGFVGSFSLTELPDFGPGFRFTRMKRRCLPNMAGTADVVRHYYGRQRRSENEPVPVLTLALTNAAIIDVPRSRLYFKKFEDLAFFEQLIGVGQTDHAKLEQLNRPERGRRIDNAGYVGFRRMFSTYSDQELMGGALNEYPRYVRRAQQLGIVAPSVSTNFGSAARPPRPSNGLHW